MKPVGILLCSFAVLAARPARANLCDGVNDGKTTAEANRDEAFYEDLFQPDSTLLGNPQWNRIILQCNRQRDNHGNEVAKVTAVAGDNAGKKLLAKADLEPKVIRGHYNFFGQLAFRQKYVYVVSRTNGVWQMVIPYRPILNDIVEHRVDFFVGRRNVDPKTRAVGPVSQEGHAWALFDASQVTGSGATAKLKSGAQPIATALCTKPTYFKDHAGAYAGQSDGNAYKRDPENKHVSLGQLQYGWKKSDAVMFEGCRVDEDRDLFWLNPDTGGLEPVKPRDFVLDNFKRVAQAYWTVDTAGTPSKRIFELKVWLKGHNDDEIPRSIRTMLRDDDELTIRFATKFLPHGMNQMYKSNLAQLNNFSTMTTDGTYQHEVGHAFGLDDEYAGKEDGAHKGDCNNPSFSALQPTTYQLCNAGAIEKRTVYHYVAVSRYVTKQSECKQDGDCAKGEYCDAGVDLEKNQCVALKADGDKCAAVGGGHQCVGGGCKFGTCYTPSSVAMGGPCFVDDQCSVGKCSALDGTTGTCVCNGDGDCGKGRYCDGGLGFDKNTCVALKPDGAACDIAGGGHQCLGGSCKFGQCYTPSSVAMGGGCFVDDQCKLGKCSSLDGTKGTCVCQRDADCGTGMYCDGGFDAKLNTCRAKLAKGKACGKTGSVGNDHKCRSGECSGFPDYVCK